MNFFSRKSRVHGYGLEQSFTPAGMYKAAQLYTSLSKWSGKQIHEHQAADLLARLQNKYPKSAYAGRSKTLLKSITVHPTFSTKKI
ncbi:MAG: N-acetylmuramoyl-L-alanine amidase, partial [Desulfobacula sp.]|nr:N-acetylmuramoyl-L-alanine amidase [Desulfobacula sp.]